MQPLKRRLSCSLVMISGFALGFLVCMASPLVDKHSFILPWNSEYTAHDRMIREATFSANDACAYLTPRASSPGKIPDTAPWFACIAAQYEAYSDQFYKFAVANKYVACNTELTRNKSCRFIVRDAFTEDGRPARKLPPLPQASSETKE